tara:strand:+ start:156 stop:461 length:306 start_codon:yes stop_codon:yes gene_type:complete
MVQIVHQHLAQAVQLAALTAEAAEGKMIVARKYAVQVIILLAGNAVMQHVVIIVLVVLPPPPLLILIVEQQEALSAMVIVPAGLEALIVLFQDKYAQEGLV